MRRFQLGAFMALTATVFVAASSGVAPAAVSPSATGSQALASGSPSAIACGGAVDARVTVNATAGSTGNATNVILALDLSSSTASQVAAEKAAALDTLNALDAADGATDSSIAGNRAGIISYQGTTATTRAALGSSYSVLVAAVNGLPASSSGSPHAAGIALADSLLAAGGAGFTKSLVLITDGQAGATEISNATAAANTAKANGVRIVPFGVGSPNTAVLQGWASQSSYYQNASGPINKAKLITDLDALVAVPTTFTVTETLGANFSAAALGSPIGTVTTGPGSLTWTATIAGNGSATLDYRATRNGSDLFASANEVVSTLGLAVSGGTASVTPPAAISIDVLPCGGTPLATTTCTGTACNTSATDGGVQYTVNAGSPPAGTQVTLFSLNTPNPPAGVCPGFSSSTQGAEFDIRPLTADATFRMVIPRASLGTRQWFQTNVCLGTNLRFITAISSLANLFPDATFVPGGSVPGRWWGLLPSIPRIAWFPGRGFVLGPYITSRSRDSAGNAIIMFRVPFVANSTGLTTDGKAGYDPKVWGG